VEFLLTDYAKTIPSFAWWDNEFTREELDILQQQAVKALDEGMAGGEINKEIRRAKVFWLHNTKESQWLYRKLSNVVSSINSEIYNFSLSGFGEPIQLTNYTAENTGTYGWHQDFNGGISRKLSLVMQLTDPAQYEGGNLELLTGGEPTRIEKKRGLITLFPSWQLHQVTPVTKGSRQSLVCWITGRPFV